MIALIFYRKIGYTFFYQNFVPEAILWACGHEFLFPKQVITELIPFLKGHVLTFDCNTLPKFNSYNTTSEFATVQPYLTWSVAWLWKALGVSYKAISLIIFILWGAYTSGLYLLFRQFFARWIAILATLFICFSPVMVSMIGSLRDFSKAPFIIWSLYLLIRTIKQSNQNKLRTFITPLAAGAIGGLGMGFRSDIYFLLPIGIIFLLIGFKNPEITGIVRHVFSKIKIALVFALSFLIFASPILKFGGPGGVGGVFIMQGMSEPFRENLKLGAASYTTGWIYSDELALSSIAANERENDPEKWDQSEQAGIPGISISQSMLLGTFNLFKWADLFIGDFTNQAIKSFSWVIGFPRYIANSNYILSNPYHNLSPEFITYSVYKKMGGVLFLALPLMGFLILLFKSYLKSKSECIALAFLLLFLGSYPAIQFHFRHFFYLEFIWILCSICSLSYFRLIWSHRKQFFKFSLGLFFLICIGITVYFCIMRYQKFILSAELKSLMSHPRDAVAIQKKESKNGNLVLTVPIPSEYLNLIESPPDSMTPALEFIGSEWDVRSAATRYLLTIKGLECDTNNVAISLNYKHSQSTWQALDQKYILNVHDSNIKRSIIFSGFYRPTQFFESISLPSSLKNCELKLERFSAKSRLPHIFTAEINSTMLIKNLGKYSP